MEILNQTGESQHAQQTAKRRALTVTRQSLKRLLEGSSRGPRAVSVHIPAATGLTKLIA